MQLRSLAKLLLRSAALFLISLNALAAPALRAPGGGAVRALVVGVDHYGKLAAAAQLKGAVADAKDIARALTSVGVLTAPLLDADATRARFVAEMDRLVSASKAGDFVIVSFAGHGMQVPEYPRWKGIEPNGVNEQIVFSGYSFSGDGAREILVNKELRAWLSRLDAKSVDVLVVMDSCFGGGMTRGWDTRAGQAAVRSIAGDSAKSDRDKFVPIQMTENEARAVVRGMPHVTFLAGATTDAVIPEASGLDPGAPMAMRGALSFFVARAIEGAASSGGSLTREQLFRYAGQNVRQFTAERQIIDIEPRSADATVLRHILFHLSGTKLPSSEETSPVRVAAVNAPAGRLPSIKKGLAPLVEVNGVSDADLVWDASSLDTLSQGDVIMHGVDESLLGGVIDRTWTIRAIQRLSVPRILTIRLREEGKNYIPGETPEIMTSDVRDRYLTVFNIAADGEVQMLFPTGGRDPYIGTDEWTYRPEVREPFGADHVVAVTTARPATEFLQWLNSHNHTRNAALVPTQIARLIDLDATTRIGTVGLYTSASRN